MNYRRLLFVDWVVVVPVAYILIISLVVLGSLSSAGNQSISISTQVIAFILGLIGAGVIMRSSQETIARVSPVLYVFSILALIAVFVGGITAQGAERWVDIAGVRFQPSEVVKIAVLLIVARLLARRKEAINRPLTFVVVLAYVALPAGFILLQPDLGTALTLVVVWLSLLAFSRFKTRKLMALILGMLIVATMMWPALAPYQQARITSFLQPDEDPLGSSYNVLQSEIAIGSGGLLGQGLEAGSQSQYNFLPSAHTDFIFAVTAEKLGILGALSILVAYLLIVLRGLAISWTAKTEFSRYTALGVTVLFMMQIVVNVGMNLGLLPVTGLPLPLMSFGGTHIIAELAMIGLLLSSATD